jgi:hypothetical protein
MNIKLTEVFEGMSGHCVQCSMLPGTCIPRGRESVLSFWQGGNSSTGIFQPNKYLSVINLKVNYCYGQIIQLPFIPFHLYFNYLKLSEAFHATPPYSTSEEWNQNKIHGPYQVHLFD